MSRPRATSRRLAVAIWNYRLALLPGMIVTGLGLGLVAPTLVDVVLAGVDPRDAGTASGALNTALQLGAAIGVALIGVVFFGALPHGRALAADPGAGHADATASALWYAAGIAVLSVLAMLLLPKPAHPDHDDEHDMATGLAPDVTTATAAVSC